MNEKMEFLKTLAKKIIVNPYIIIIAIFAIMMYFLVLPSSPKKETSQKIEYKISTFDNLVKGEKKEVLSDDEEEKMLLEQALEEKPVKKQESKKQPTVSQEKKPTITEEYADKIAKILQASRYKKPEVKKPLEKNDNSQRSKRNVYSQEILKTVYKMLNSNQTGIVVYINDNLRNNNIIGDSSQLIKIRGEIPVVCETARLLCEEKIAERVPYARCITLYKHCMNTKDFQEISLEEYKLYRK